MASPRLRMALALGGVVAVTGLGAFTVASAVVPTQSPDAALSPAALRPAPASAVVLPITVRDKFSHSPWAVRLYSSETGLTCKEVGHAQDGEFGQVDPNGDFHALPLPPEGNCIDLNEVPVSNAVNYYPPAGDQPARFVVFGVMNPDKVADVYLMIAGAKRALTINNQAYFGEIAPQEIGSAELVVALVDGASQHIGLQRDQPVAPVSDLPPRDG